MAFWRKSQSSCHWVFFDCQECHANFLFQSRARWFISFSVQNHTLQRLGTTHLLKVLHAILSPPISLERWRNDINAKAPWQWLEDMLVIVNVLHPTKFKMQCLTYQSFEEVLNQEPLQAWCNTEEVDLNRNQGGSENRTAWEAEKETSYKLVHNNVKSIAHELLTS